MKESSVYESIMRGLNEALQDIRDDNYKLPRHSYIHEESGEKLQVKEVIFSD